MSITKEGVEGMSREIHGQFYVGKRGHHLDMHGLRVIHTGTELGWVLPGGKFTNNEGTARDTLERMVMVRYRWERCLA
jgi:hypothetical protein